MDNLPERQPLFDAADYCIVLGAVPFQSLPIGCVAGLIVLARHWSLLSHGFLLLLGVRQVTPFWVAVFPGAVKYLGEKKESNEATPPADDQADKPDRRPDNALSGNSQKPPRLALDKTRQGLIEELLTLGWTVTDFRREGIFRGDNTTISQEVAEARKRLGMAPPEEYRTPIAGRPTNAVFPDEEPKYQAPPR